MIFAGRGLGVRERDDEGLGLMGSEVWKVGNWGEFWFRSVGLRRKICGPQLSVFYGS